MRDADVPAAVAVCQDALWGPDPADASGWWQRARVAHLLGTDPGGAWVAEDGGGAVAGVAMALVRERVWGLSLLAVAEARQGRGFGRALLDAALGTAANCDAAIVLSSERPAAMRLYATSGFALHPCVSACGEVRVRPEPDPRVRTGDERDLPWMDEVSRHVRGAGHGRDAPLWLARGARLLCVPDEGWLVGLRGRVAALAARSDAVATALLEAHLAAAPAGENAVVGFVSAGHDWAVRACLAAGLALSPDGPIFTRGRLGTMRPYLPNGAFL